MQPEPASSAPPRFESCKLCGGSVSSETVHEELVRCGQCDLVFAAPRYGEAQLAEIYQQLYSRQGAYSPHLSELDRIRKGEEVSLGWNRDVLLREVGRRRVEHLAELGAGVGVVAHHVRVKKLPMSYVGYEPQPETAQAAAEVGLAIRQGGWQEMLAGEGESSKDAIVAFEVLEHVQELKETLEGLRRVLKKGGVLAFSVPNYDRRLDFEPGDRLHQDPPPIHVNFWRPASLRNTLELAGFTPVMVKVRTRPYFDPRRLWRRWPLYWRWMLGRLHGPTLLAVAEK